MDNSEAAGCYYHLLIVRRGGVTRCKYVMATAAHLQGVDRPGTATNRLRNELSTHYTTELYVRWEIANDADYC